MAIWGEKMVFLWIGISGIAILIFLLWAERGRLLRKSTLAGLKAHGLKGFLNLNALHMYIYGRWNPQYNKILRYYIIPRLRTKGKQKLANSYHSKVLTPEHARNIITLNQSIPLQELEQIILYPIARKIVLEHPLDIVVDECSCRVNSPHPCTPSKVCMTIGKPFTDFIIEHRPGSKRVTQQEALDLLEEVHNNGCVHTAWFKDAMLGRFYGICNCCKCCCNGIQAMMNYDVPMVLPSGYSANKTNEICTNCGSCRKACPFEAISDTYEICKEKCMGCGVCVVKCNKKAISLQRDASKGIPLDVKSSSLDLPDLPIFMK